ncbi:hypothetical protein LX64_02203 [Chitinophaga skermanii]|uniref:Uncharacterized protein n=1 Tax=Chitinophaga skermanii TaxID=331697 RepID=A0A327QKJ2_9BACT|nr:hypothetical protein [Chitinophaga skermanii]RAJ05049.1 hypothetical protein LX64_02203 [Chitinophaga skermanii]
MSNAMYLHPKHLHKVAFYPTANGYLTVTRQRKPTNWQADCYEKIRSHRKEFGRAAQTAAAIRLAFKQIIDVCPDTTMYRRMSSKLLEIIKSDTSLIRGDRTVEGGDMHALLDFQFNKDVNFYRVCHVTPTIHLNRKAGMAELTLPSFNPQYDIRAPKNTTHFKMVAAVHALHFDTNETNTVCVKTSTLAINEALPNGLTLQVPFQAGDNRHLFVSIGIEFIEILNSREYSIKAGHKNAVCIARVYPKPVTQEVPLANVIPQTIHRESTVAIKRIAPRKKEQHMLQPVNTRKKHRSLIGTKYSLLE